MSLMSLTSQQKSRSDLAHPKASRLSALRQSTASRKVFQRMNNLKKTGNSRQYFKLLMLAILAVVPTRAWLGYSEAGLDKVLDTKGLLKVRVYSVSQDTYFNDGILRKIQPSYIHEGIVFKYRAVYCSGSNERSKDVAFDSKHIHKSRNESKVSSTGRAPRQDPPAKVTAASSPPTTPKRIRGNRGSKAKAQARAPVRPANQRSGSKEEAQAPVRPANQRSSAGTGSSPRQDPATEIISPEDFFQNCVEYKQANSGWSAWSPQKAFEEYKKYCPTKGGLPVKKSKFQIAYLQED